MSTDVQAEREAFEAWCAKERIVYSQAIELAWQAWQASRASAPATELAGQQNTDGASTGVSQASVAAEVAPQPSTTLSAPQAQEPRKAADGQDLRRALVDLLRGYVKPSEALAIVEDIAAHHWALCELPPPSKEPTGE